MKGKKEKEENDNFVDSAWVNMRISSNYHEKKKLKIS